MISLKCQDFANLEHIQESLILDDSFVNSELFKLLFK